MIYHYSFQPTKKILYTCIYIYQLLFIFWALLYFVFNFKIYLRNEETQWDRLRSHPLIHPWFIPQILVTSPGWARPKSGVSLPCGRQGPKSFNHPQGLPGRVLTGSWGWKQSQDLNSHSILTSWPSTKPLPDQHPTAMVCQNAIAQQKMPRPFMSLGNKDSSLSSQRSQHIGKGKLCYRLSSGLLLCTTNKKPQETLFSQKTRCEWKES